MTTSTENFPRETAGLPRSAAAIVELADGDRSKLRIAPVAKRIGDATVRMLAYNGSIPGPTLQRAAGLRGRRQRRQRRRPRGDRALARAAARQPLRRHARDAGADRRSAAASPYRIAFPDPGVYWYHPHIREDYGQEMGLYGNIVVVPADPDYWPPVHRELAPHPRRHPDRGRPDRAVQPHRDDLRRDGPLRQRAARRRRDRTSSLDRAARARSFASTSRTPPTPASSTSRSRAPG